MVRSSQVFASLSLMSLVLVAAPAFAGGPQLGLDIEPEDHHDRPEFYETPGFADDYIPLPSQEDAEYPLAASFNPADASNYSAGGMISYDYVVVHTVQGSYAGCQSWFQNSAANVSAHFVARSSDGEVTQMVHLSDKAWHVGSSNGYAIGIEHEGFIDEPAWYTWEMYSGSALLSRWIADELAIPLDRDHIVGHVELPNQTHTDPGDNWNWALYMALITDIVDEGRVEGYVVDNTAQCTITATSDTWVKTTLEDSAELDDTQKCSIPAGTQLTYLHADDDMYGHHRLYYEAGGPCDGFIDLDRQGFVYDGHFSGFCEDAEVAAAGVTVVLDGGAQVETDANGYFAFDGVGPGAHTIDLLEGDYEATLEPIELDVYPGTRVVIGADPIADGGSGDSGDSGDSADEGGADDEGECWIGAQGCACTPGGGCDPGLVCDSTNICVPEGSGESGEDGSGGNGNADEVGGEEDAGLDYLEADSCAVDEERQGAPLGLALVVLMSVLRRREKSLKKA
ncbi:N-acetylmuramoyl-L-alanine amidase [Pseudenhygromyxa sp. WMMC2535]|uniref:N-acetylmuramoyl-L-alanine amidase n=1 Tax=Pseudenhygromyxa sp. WMMC2535 TaxID=2712867 RepID=UPI001557229E|nr:N-acetylmuramoyl-L-alanine amidase [Pseudenhygromyxa sp. WMMC2535]NVB39188.1 N-acetylmuramoyl-L-alanine amidase [Pseudenhygromyxa sp. WMMC2535]